MNKDAEIRQLIERVRNDYTLSLSDLLKLLKKRIGRQKALSQLMQGDLISHDEIENLIIELIEQGLLPPDYSQNPNQEPGLWLMALQSAATADTEAEWVRKRRPRVTESHLRQSRSELILVLRELWSNTGVAFLPKVPINKETGYIRLSWNAKPRDLDLHLLISATTSGIQINYQQMGSLERQPWAQLDRDISNGSGPETISIQQWVKGKYQCAVHNYSQDVSLADSKAIVELRFGDKKQVFECPNKGEGDWWSVFVLNTKSNNIKAVNQIVRQPWKNLNP